jgi:hypothetical protein
MTLCLASCSQPTSDSSVDVAASSEKEVVAIEALDDNSAEEDAIRNLDQIPAIKSVSEGGVTFHVGVESQIHFLNLSIDCGGERATIKEFLQNRRSQARREYGIDQSYDVGSASNMIVLTETTSLSSGKKLTGYPDKVMHFYELNGNGATWFRSEPQTGDVDPVTFMRMHQAAVCGGLFARRGLAVGLPSGGQITRNGRQITYNPFTSADTSQPSSTPSPPPETQAVPEAPAESPAPEAELPDPHT